MKKCRLIFWMMQALLLSFSPSVTGAEAVPEYAMKAAFLYNFSLFTEWPELSGNTFNMCIFGHPALAYALDTIEGKQVYNRPITVSYLTNLDNLKNCQILYLDASESVGVEKILGKISASPVLTVTDSPEVMQHGFMIGMLIENRRIVFEINQQAVQRAHLNISSKLLRLAKTVY